MYTSSLSGEVRLTDGKDPVNPIRASSKTNAFDHTLALADQWYFQVEICPQSGNSI